jgi:hypothetical protein
MIFSLSFLWRLIYVRVGDGGGGDGGKSCGSFFQIKGSTGWVYI